MVAGSLLIGSDSLAVTDTGKVGVGTASPIGKLNVVSSSDTQLRLSYDGSNYVDFVVDSSGTFTIKSPGAMIYELSAMSTAGNFGIGTTSPSDSLTVNGSISAETMTVSDSIYAGSFHGDGLGLTNLESDTKMIFVPAGAWYVSGATEEITNYISNIKFANSAQHKAYCSFIIPENYATVSSVKLCTIKTTTGNLYVQFIFTRYRDGTDKVEDSTFPFTAVSTSGTIGTTRREDINVASAAFDGLSEISGDIIGFKVERDAVNALDTYEDYINVIGLEVIFSK